jgi:succinoglycan biosynthesis protein ExoA
MTALVSVIIPCYNERDTIGLLLQAIEAQTYPLDRMEVVIADGMSEDGTRDVVTTYAQTHPKLSIRLVDNPDRIIPAALNRAIDAAQGDVIVRLDAHSIPRPDYVERCVEIMAETGAANVGGCWEIQPSDKRWISKSIAVAAANWLGAGDARYRISGQPGEVDTVPFGAYRREWIQRVGPFDETLLTNEDYEFNVRLRKAGGIIWFDPSIRSIYFSRAGLISLARQYWRYGYWKARMLRRYPGSLRLRQALPFLFVLTLLVFIIAVPFISLAGLLLSIQLTLYVGITGVAGLLEAFRRQDLALLIGFPLAIWTMHIAWGTAFLWSTISGLLGGYRESG